MHISGRSCTTQLLEVVDIMVENSRSCEKYIDVVYLDFAKAFDTASHRRLLMKLKGYGGSRKHLDLVPGVPEKQKQCVIVNGEKDVW